MWKEVLVAKFLGWFTAAILAIILLSTAGTSDPNSGEMPTPEPAGSTLPFTEGETAYVTASALNARTSPEGASEVKAKLAHGEAVTILKRAGEWLQIVKNGQKLWIAAQHVSSTRPVAPQGLMAARSSPSPRPAKSQSSRPTPSYGGACPCSGRNVCIGPRGGRYCITSGGNKRYGV